MSLCIAVVVNRKYQKYVPVFTYFCLRSYPDIGVRIFLVGSGLKEKYSGIMNELAGDVIIKEAFKNYPKSNQELKMLRWFLPEDSFNGYDNVYIGDVDMLICGEDMSLEEQHIKHCKEMGMTYSNMVRPNSKHRLSGLHFIRKEKYYERMGGIINKYSKLLKSGKLKQELNETILYKMMKESDLGLPTKMFWAHHGIHLGYWRKGERKNKISEEVWKIVGKENYKTYFKFFKMVEKEVLYRRVYRAEPLTEIRHMKKDLSIDLEE